MYQALAPAAPRLGLGYLFALAMACLLMFHPAWAAPEINTLKGGFFGGRSDTAIRGYDTVAYFTVGAAVKGNAAFRATWKGAKWQFASKANLELFKAHPEKYAPQYGGYCAYGVAVDDLVSIEPEQFTVMNGKLYLNYNADIQKKWQQSPARFIKTADAKYPQLLQEK